MDISDFQMDFFSLAGKKAIVTGGNTGLGQAFTLALAKAGADVFVPSMMDDDGTHRPPGRGCRRPLRVPQDRHHATGQCSDSSSTPASSASARSTSS